MKQLLLLAIGLLMNLSAIAANNPTIEIKTSVGTVLIELYPDKAR